MAPSPCANWRNVLVRVAYDEDPSVLARYIGGSIDGADQRVSRIAMTMQITQLPFERALRGHEPPSYLDDILEAEDSVGFNTEGRECS
jgi:hypothetical protein